MRKRLLSFTLVIFSFILLLDIGLHLPYPLLWNDESATAMLTKSVIRFGYPRILYDGNLITQLPRIALENLSDSKLASKENGWLTYYFAAPFVFISEMTGNIYLKTAIIRIPFLLQGVISIFLFCRIVGLFFKSSFLKNQASLLFLLVIIADIPLILHIREARYYSLLLLLIGLFWYILLRFAVFSTFSYRFFLFTIPIICVAILLTYPPAVFPCIATLAVASCICAGHFRKPSLKSLFPVFLTACISIPILLFFDVFHLAELTAKTYHITVQKTVMNVIYILSVLYKDTLLLFSVTIILVVIFSYLHTKQKSILRQYLSVAFLIFIFFSSTLLILSRLPYLFTRYFIFLNPLIYVVTISGILLIREVSLSCHLRWRKLILLFLFILTVYNLTILNGREKARRIVGHIYELTHKYEGPLDVIIPYILTHTTQPEKLIIATNYEEFSYMYYLKSQVIVGYVGINLKEDLKLTPDIIIFRPGWGTNPEIFRSFFKKSSYDEITFPFLNYPLNNIPEFYFKYPHQFQTQYALIEKEKVRIFVRKGILQS